MGAKKRCTLPETNSSPIKIPIFPGNYHPKCWISMAMLVYRSFNSMQQKATESQNLPWSRCWMICLAKKIALVFLCDQMW